MKCGKYQLSALHICDIGMLCCSNFIILNLKSLSLYCAFASLSVCTVGPTLFYVGPIEFYVFLSGRPMLWASGPEIKIILSYLILSYLILSYYA